MEVVIDGGMNSKRLIIKQKDLDLLQFLEKHRMMKLQHLHDYYVSYLDQPITYDGFRKRVAKFESYNIISGSEYSLGQLGFRYKYYRIGSKGIDLLIECRLLPDTYNKKLISTHSKRKNVDHYLATQEVVTKTLLLDAGQKEILSLSPSTNPYTSKVSAFNKIVVPDWILTKDDLHLNLEVDTGSELIQELEDKVLRYIDLQSQYSNIRHSVLFSVVDHTFLSRYSYGNRERRISNIKENLMLVPGIRESNLEVLVVSMHRAYDTAFKALKNLRREELKRHDELKQIMHSLDINRSFPYSLTEYTQDKLKSKKMVYHPDFLMNEVSQDKKRNRIGMFLYMREGDIRCLDKLQYLSNKDHLASLGCKVDFLIAIYETKDEMVKDIIGFDTNDILFGNMDELGNFMADPVFYRRTSISRLEVTKYA